MSGFQISRSSRAAAIILVDTQGCRSRFFHPDRSDLASLLPIARGVHGIVCVKTPCSSTFCIKTPIWPVLLAVWEPADPGFNTLHRGAVFAGAHGADPERLGLLRPRREGARGLLGSESTESTESAVMSWCKASTAAEEGGSCHR